MTNKQYPSFPRKDLALVTLGHRFILQLRAFKVYDFKKEIDARFPNVEVWWVGLEWYSSNKKNFIKPLFLVNDGDASFGTYGTAVHWANDFIFQEFYILFETANEIQSLIDALNISKIKASLNRDMETEALFQ